MTWPNVKLKDLVEIKTGKLDSNAAEENGAFPFFTCDPQTLRINTWAYDQEAVLLAGNNASGNYTAKYYNGKFNAYQRTYIIASNNADILSTRFFAYALNLKLQYLKSISSGATTKFLTLSMLQSMSIPLPPLPVQRRIADILSAYDDLIENNRKQIKLLEEAAQRLYKEWFIDLRFPGHEHTPIIDGIPDGWKKTPFGDIANIIMGQSPKSEFYNKAREGLPFHQGVGSYGDRFVVGDIYSSSFTKIAMPGDILFSVRAPVGRLNITLNKIVIGRGLSALRHKDDLQSFLFYMLKELFFKDDIVGNGSIFASVSKDELSNFTLTVPSESLCRAFDKIASAIDRRIEILSKGTCHLQEVRDRLLPRLMGGISGVERKKNYR